MSALPLGREPEDKWVLWVPGRGFARFNGRRLTCLDNPARADQWARRSDAERHQIKVLSQGVFLKTKDRKEPTDGIPHFRGPTQLMQVRVTVQILHTEQVVDPEAT